MKKQNEERGSNLVEIATELSKIKTDMQLMESMAESFPKLSEIEESDLEMHYFRAERYFETLFNKFQYLEYTLDELQTRLYEEVEK